MTTLPPDAELSVGMLATLFLDYKTEENAIVATHSELRIRHLEKNAM